MIQVKEISKKYGKAEVLNIQCLEIPTGESFGLVGNNGAGKTTSFNIMLDLVRPTTGAITNNNIQVNESEEWKTFTSSFIDETFLIGYLTAEEYFEFIGDLRGMNKADVQSFLVQFDEFFNGEILGKKKYLRDLSKGNQKKAGIVAALIGSVFSYAMISLGLAPGVEEIILELYNAGSLEEEQLEVIAGFLNSPLATAGNIACF